MVGPDEPSTSSMSRSAKFLVAVVGGGLVISLVLALAWPKRAPGKLGVHLAGTPQSSNGVLLVTVVLTNGTPRVLNVVDDSCGKPAFILDERSGRRRTDDTWGTQLTDLANQLKINLAPGATLTNTVCVTNPPSRFRLRVYVRDLAAERRGFPLCQIVPRALAMKVVEWRQRRQNPDVVLPASPWIEPGEHRP
jgi:hypothetical protein